MLDRNTDAIVHEAIADHRRLVAVPAPEPVRVAFHSIADELIAAEGGFHAVGGREAEVIHEKEIVVRPALARVHRFLTGPEKQAVAAVRHGIVGHDVVQALLEHE